MRVIREPAVAGLFYSDNPQTLRHSVARYLQLVEPQPAPTTGDKNHDYLEAVPKALIVPHAGYVYSGNTAASAYRALAPASKLIKRVVLLGPSHRVGFKGVAFCSSDAFRTPMGDVPVDQSSFVAISNIPEVKLLDSAHQQEHSLEVQLPFLQFLFSDFTLVPLVVGEASQETVARILDALWGADETLIVISSDLSHFHDYQTAQAIDKKTCQAIEQLAPEQIGYEQACGRNPVKGLLCVARQRGLDVKTLSRCNSGDTAGDLQRVVGYGAWAFYDNG
ncbi:AmmeMemoRadiSam system protein B [Ketobacter sp.]